MIEAVEFAFDVLGWVLFALFTIVWVYFASRYAAKGWYKGRGDVNMNVNINFVDKNKEKK